MDTNSHFKRVNLNKHKLRICMIADLPVKDYREEHLNGVMMILYAYKTPRIK